MVRNKFLVVLAGFFQAESQNKQLLAPIRELDEVVHLEFWFQIPVRII